jgi:hypothetical protein
LKISVKNEEQTILDLKKQIQVRDIIIEQKETRIFEEKLKMKDLEKQLLLTKENVNELEQTVEPLIMEIQDKKRIIEDVSTYLLHTFNSNDIKKNTAVKESNRNEDIVQFTKSIRIGH